MTALTNSARNAIHTRLEDLYQQRSQATADSLSAEASGDVADRAGNVEALIRLEIIEGRITELEVELQKAGSADAQAPSPDAAGIGSQVTLSFDADDEPETYLLSAIEHTNNNFSVITPTSPLGQALQGAHQGDQITYQSPQGRKIRAKVLKIAS
jgi:transcription elongation factor GreA